MKSKFHAQSGFTVMESMVAIALFSISALAMANVFAKNISYNTTNEIKTGAIEAAQQVLDEARFSDPSFFPNGGQVANEDVKIGNRTYNTSTTYCRTPTYCTSNTIRSLYVQVQYKGTTYYEIETVYTQLR